MEGGRWPSAGIARLPWLSVADMPKLQWRLLNRRPALAELRLDQANQIRQFYLCRHFPDIGKPDVINLTGLVRSLFAHQRHSDENTVPAIFQAYSNQLSLLSR
ncbi:MAG: hypothetical protein ACE5FQ_14730 [Thiogranum sp.]